MQFFRESESAPIQTVPDNRKGWFYINGSHSELPLNCIICSGSRGRHGSIKNIKGLNYTTNPIFAFLLELSKTVVIYIIYNFYI